MYEELLMVGPDGRRRCRWPGGHADYLDYHDREWGVPCRDERRLFEKLCLEGFQSGLSWLTILRKRENFRRAFCDFDIDRLARMKSSSVDRLLRDPGIVRHRGKIESVLHNARRARELRAEQGSLADFFWRYAERRPFPGVIPKSESSIALSKELRRRGFTYVGPTTCYAFMQAMGLVDDHVPGCFRRGAAREEDR
jgi:DNA-3-methyladenine glycosylase I